MIAKKSRVPHLLYPCSAAALFKFGSLCHDFAATFAKSQPDVKVRLLRALPELLILVRAMAGAITSTISVLNLLILSR